MPKSPSRPPVRPAARPSHAPERATATPAHDKAVRPVTMAEAEAAISTFVETLHHLTRSPGNGRS